MSKESMQKIKDPGGNKINSKDTQQILVTIKEENLYQNTMRTSSKAHFLYIKSQNVISNNNAAKNFDMYLILIQCRRKTSSPLSSDHVLSNH